MYLARSFRNVSRVQTGLPLRWTLLPGRSLSAWRMSSCLQLAIAFSAAGPATHTILVVVWNRVLVIALHKRRSPIVTGMRWIIFTDIRQPAAYRSHSSVHRLNWKIGYELTRESPAQTSQGCPETPISCTCLQTQEFYKWKFDEAVQMPRKAVIFWLQGRAWQPNGRAPLSSHSVSRRACRCAPLDQVGPRNKSGSVTVVPLRSCMERSIAARRMFRRSMTSGGPSLTGLKTCESEFPSFEPTLWYLVKRNHHHPSNSSCYSNCDATHRNRSVGARTGKDIAIAGFTALKNHH